MSALFLIAQIAGRWIAVPADQVDSAVDIGTVVAVPRASAAVRGLAALRSRVVTVIDTRVALGLAPTPQAGRAIIAKFDGHFYAFLVDAFDDVFPFDPMPLSSGLALEGRWGASAIGIVERDDEPMLVLDLAALVPGTLAVAA
ncbi:chemotaxis protein CheW [Sphingomonas mollis]|uniref:Chemotaxis protein CheW n=1 Tax=Sphingomonas mollis TaxID=2795726 RepID=A0ABS0XSX4_9SPHN|nr:chemotaxis protein CheW [Sphingomonas sp. BT553]MBJ6123147.1 chemotaxis protein CheW [Sphingomonas sp. BT553]